MKITDFIKELEGVRERWGNVETRVAGDIDLHWLSETTALLAGHGDSVKVVVATVKKEEK